MAKTVNNARQAAALRGESDLGAPSRMRAEPANLCLLLSVGKGRSRIAAR
jgi:hypothetical protein